MFIYQYTYKYTSMNKEDSTKVSKESLRKLVKTSTLVYNPTSNSHNRVEKKLDEVLPEGYSKKCDPIDYVEVAVEFGYKIDICTDGWGHYLIRANGVWVRGDEVPGFDAANYSNQTEPGYNACEEYIRLFSIVQGELTIAHIDPSTKSIDELVLANHFHEDILKKVSDDLNLKEPEYQEQLAA